MVDSFAVIEAGALIDAQGIDQPVPWWSFTKTILAAGALALVRDGRLALDRALPQPPDREADEERMRQHRIDLDGNHSLGARQKVRRQSPAPGPDLNQDFAFFRTSRLGDSFQNRLPHQKMLP